MLLEVKNIFKSEAIPTTIKDSLKSLWDLFEEPKGPTVSAMEINSVVEFFKDKKTQNVINILNKIMTLPQEEYMTILKSMKIETELKSVVQDLPKIVSDAKTEAKEIVKENSEKVKTDAEEFAKILLAEYKVTMPELNSSKEKTDVEKFYSGCIENIDKDITHKKYFNNGYIDWSLKPLIRNSFRRISNEEILNEKVTTTPKQYKEEIEETEE